MKQIRYSNDEITVIWQPELCQHSTICFTQMPAVFNPQKSHWVNMDGASTEQIIEQVKKCPSGALSYRYNDEINEHDL
jgi:putative redox protein